jgi:hypothetical protein
MSISTKSGRAVISLGYEVGKEQLSSYSHESSPRKYTQPQLFGCLVLKTFYGFDYRATEAFLKDFSEIRKVLELSSVPHFTTLQKACQRLLKTNKNVIRLLEETLVQFSLKKCTHI